VDLGKLLRRRYRSDIDLQKIRFNFRIHETHSRNWSASVEYDHGGVVPFVMSFSGKAIDEDVLWDQMSMVYAEWQYPLPNEKTGPS
jgi:ABC-type sulfate transport system substrate-binding protein